MSGTTTPAGRTRACRKTECCYLPTPPFSLPTANWKSQNIVDVSAYAGVKGYVFTRPADHLWMVWSLDGIDHIMNLPQSPLSVWDALGNPVSASGNLITVTIKPLYIEMP